MEVQRYQIPQQQNSIPSYFKQRSKSKHIFLRMWNANLVSSFVDINISSSLRVTQQYNWTLPLLCIAVSSLLSSTERCKHVNFVGYVSYSGVRVQLTDPCWLLFLLDSIEFSYELICASKYLGFEYELAWPWYESWATVCCKAYYNILLHYYLLPRVYPQR